MDAASWLPWIWRLGGPLACVAWTLDGRYVSAAFWLAFSAFLEVAWRAGWLRR